MVMTISIGIGVAPLMALPEFGRAIRCGEAKQASGHTGEKQWAMGSAHERQARSTCAWDDCGQTACDRRRKRADANQQQQQESEQ